MRAIFGFLCLVLAGCTGPVLRSDPYPAPGAGPVKALISYALPTMGYPFTLKRDAACAITFAAGTPFYMPDPRHRYVISYRVDAGDRAFPSDTLAVDTEDGLLKSVNATSENQTKQIVNDAFALAEAVAGAAATDVQPEACTPFDTAMSVPVNTIPLNASTKLKILDENAKNVTVKVVVAAAENDVPKTSVTGEVSTTGASSTGTPVNDGAAIFYRPPARYIVTIQVDDTSIKSTTPHITRMYEVVAPDSNRIFAIPFQRKAFAKFDVKLTFTHGMLTKFESNDDAEAMAALENPTDIIKGTLGFGGGSAISAH